MCLRRFHAISTGGHDAYAYYTFTPYTLLTPYCLTILFWIWIWTLPLPDTFVCGSATFRPPLFYTRRRYTVTTTFSFSNRPCWSFWASGPVWIREHSVFGHAVSLYYVV
jgi:hypothetical protein